MALSYYAHTGLEHIQFSRLLGLSVARLNIWSESTPYGFDHVLIISCSTSRQAPTPASPPSSSLREIQEQPENLGNNSLRKEQIFKVGSFL